MDRDIFERLEEHERRVVEERAELSDRVTKLSAFLGGDVAGSLGEVDIFLLRSQFVWMRSYLDVLDRRIELFTSRLEREDGVDRLGKSYSNGEELIGFFGGEDPSVFLLKRLASTYVDCVERFGKSYRRNDLAVTDMEKSVMMAVKSLF